MKKITMMLVAAASITFAACGGSTSKDKKDVPQNADSVKIETPAPVVAAADTIPPAELITKYEALVKQSIPLLIKVQKGDAKAAAEYQKVNKELISTSADIERNIARFTEKEKEKYQVAAKKLSETVNPTGDKK